LKQGASFLLDATLDDDLVSMTFDGLKKVDGPSKLGDFHYIPILFHEGRQVRTEQRLLLEVYGLLLSRLQGLMPPNGLIWHGKDCKATRVRLNADLRKTERLLRDLKEVCSSESLPRLILNDHCQVCEFRQRCHAQAVQEDNLSLLRGMGEKEITRENTKGIFTVTQFSYTFRPRRKKKTTVHSPRKHHHSLQALAIRENTIFVAQKPAMPLAKTFVYLDVEGIRR
jgi:predicted RecB family nuclease